MLTFRAPVKIRHIVARYGVEEIAIDSRISPISGSGPRRWTCIRAWLACLILLVSGSRAAADTKSWTGAVSGLWSEGGNWNGGVAPINGDSVVFPSGPGNFGLMTNDLSGLSLQS